MERTKEEEFVIRFFKYKLLIGGRTSCHIEELARCTGRKKEFVRRDLHEMIRQGYFMEGYLVCKETILILDREVYQKHWAEKQQKRRKETHV